MELQGQAKIGVVGIDPWTAYLIDSRSEACFLRVIWNPGASVAVTPVSCAALKRNVPEAARFITWDPSPGPAPGR
jgi:hypothetical protein